MWRGDVFYLISETGKEKERPSFHRFEKQEFSNE